MSKFFLIYKTIFKQKFRIDKSTKRAKSTKIGMIILFVVLGILWGPILVVQLLAMAQSAAAAGLGVQYLSMVYTLVQGITLIFGTILLVNTLFNTRENEFFATVPLKPQTIFFAKLAYVVTNELILAGTIGAIAVVVYGIVAQMGIMFYVLGLISILLAPLLSLLVSSILLFPLSYIMSYIKKSTTLSSILSIGAFLIFMVVYMTFFGGMMQSMTDVAQIGALIKSTGELLFFNIAMGNVVMMGSGFVASLGIVLGIYAAGLLLTYLLSSFIYKRSLSMQSEVSHTNIKKMGYQSTGIVKSLMARDLKCIKRDTSMLFQCGMMLILPALIIVLLFGVMYKQMGIATEESAMMLDTMGIFMLVMFTSGTNAAASSAISRENRNFYIMKIIPVPYELQIKAKLLVAVAFGAFGAVTGGIACIVMGMNVIKGIVIVAICLIMCYGFSCMQIKMDLDKPKLNWDNFTEAVKNSRTAIMSMLFSMLFSIVILVIILLPTIFNGVLPLSVLVMEIISYVIALAVTGIFSFISSRALNKNIVKFFDKIEC